MKSFSDRLCRAIIEKKTPLVVGIDPVLEQLPLRQSALAAGHRRKAYIKFILSAGPACRWEELRLIGHKMGSTGTLTFRLPRPHAIRPSGRR